jgi:hypothetical protein
MTGMTKDIVDERKPRSEKRNESRLEHRRRLEESLESGLEGTFPGSDAISVVQPPPNILDGKAQVRGREGDGNRMINRSNNVIFPCIF